jgi:polysaccharide pyruvyl transferase WcaK-like protein
VDFHRHLIGFSVREPGPAAPDIDPDEYYGLLANAADFVVERLDADVLFVPMETTDVQHSHAVVAHMRRAERAEILRRRYSPGQVLDVVGRLELAVGMRLHFLIFAALQGTPFVALPYASKVMGLLDDLTMETPPLGSVGVGQLIASLDRSWDTREQIRAKLKQRVPGCAAGRCRPTTSPCASSRSGRAPARPRSTEGRLGRRSRSPRGRRDGLEAGVARPVRDATPAAPPPPAPRPPWRAPAPPPRRPR